MWHLYSTQSQLDRCPKAQYFYPWFRPVSIKHMPQLPKKHTMHAASIGAKYYSNTKPSCPVRFSLNSHFWLSESVTTCLCACATGWTCFQHRVELCFNNLITGDICCHPHIYFTYYCCRISVAMICHKFRDTPPRNGL